MTQYTNNKYNPVVQERWYKTFLGVRQQHTYWMYKVFDDAISNNQQLGRFVEIGTGVGAVSVILALHAVQASTHLLTYDNRPELHSKLMPIFHRLGIEDKSSDHWEDIDHIKAYMNDIPTFFFCDGGDKKREFNFYVPLIPRKSVIAAHDYGMEFTQEDIQETVNKYNLFPIQQNEWVGGKDDIQTCLYYKP